MARITEAQQREFRRSQLPLELLLVQPLSRWKRLVDFIASSTALLLLSPLMVVIAASIKLTSGGPVLFVQERTGQGLRRFKMYKFRTMIQGAEKEVDRVKHLNEMSGPLTKIRNDPRHTRIGRILRKTSMDELPQLINVIRGDMTIIGPRALSPLPSAYEHWQLRRFQVKPGIACEWQAESRGRTDFSAWMRSDLRYMEQASLLTDLSILLRTLRIVISGEGGR